MLQAFGAGLGAAVMAYVFSKLSPKQRGQAAIGLAVCAVFVVVYATAFIVR